MNIRLVFFFVYFYIIFCIHLIELNRALRIPIIASGDSTRCLSNLFPFGLPTRVFNFRGRNVITFYSFQTGETQSEDKGEERTRVKETREYDRTKGRRSRNELRRLKRRDEEYPQAQQHDYEPQLCLRRLPAMQRSSGTVDYESSFDNLWKRYFSFLYIYQKWKGKENISE